MEHQRTLNTLLSGEIQTLEISDKPTNYCKNYNHIVKKLGGMTEQQLQVFVEVLGRVKVVVIFLDEEQDENSVFESINSAGKPLSGADLIKNFIFTFKRFQVTHDQENQLIELYTRKFEGLFTDTGNKEDDIEKFFREYLAVKTADKVNKDPKIIYYSFKKWVGEIYDYAHCKQLIIDLIKWATFYQTLRVGSHPDIDQISVCYLRSSFLTYAAVLMDILDKLSTVTEGVIKISDKKAVNDIIKKLVAYDACRFLAGNQIKEITRFIPTVPKKLESVDPNYWHDYAGAFQRLVTTTQEGYRQPSVELIERRITDIDLYSNKDQLKRFLILIDNIDQNEIISFDAKGCQIEHIMPQTLSKQWSSVSEQLHQRYLHALGNLSITFDNQGLGNKGFIEKRKYLAERSRIRINQMLLDYDVFDEAAIKDRAYKILEKFFIFYKIERTGYEEEVSFCRASYEIKPAQWLEKVRNYHDSSAFGLLINPSSWKAICDFAGIDVGANSAHRCLEQWVQRNKPDWPSTF